VLLPIATSLFEQTNYENTLGGLDTLGFRLMGLIALHIDKKEFDDEVILVFTTLLDYEFQIRD
jgi:hypothetical protein